MATGTDNTAEYAPYADQISQQVSQAKLDDFANNGAHMTMSADHVRQAALSDTANVNMSRQFSISAEFEMGGLAYEAPELQTAGPNNEVSYTVGQPQVNPDLIGQCHNATMLADIDLKLPEPSVSSPVADLFGGLTDGLSELTSQVNKDFLQTPTPTSAPDFTPVPKWTPPSLTA